MDTTPDFFSEDIRNDNPPAEEKKKDEFVSIGGVLYKRFEPRVPYKRPPPKFWTVDEMKRMLALTKGRDYIALGLGFFLGLRVNELRNMKVGDIDWRSMEVFVLGKGAKKASIPMLKDATQFWVDLKNWVEGREVDSYILSWGKRPFSSKTYNRIVQKYAKLANVSFKDDAHFHMLRHSRATNLYSEIGDLSQVQEFLRHNWINTTEVYKHSGTKELRRKMNRGLHEF